MKKGLILANGTFPTHPTPVNVLKSGLPVICCDGSTTKLVKHNIEPYAIVGDLDSVSESLKERFADRLYYNPDQETNDLTKAVQWCIANHFTSIIILGATGLREDHTLGNISLLAQYAKDIDVEMLTDHGSLTTFRGTQSFSCFPGEQISIFSLTPEAGITTHNLKYPLNNSPLKSWWQGTLNETTDNTFAISSEEGIIIIYRNYQQ